MMMRYECLNIFFFFFFFFFFGFSLLSFFFPTPIQVSFFNPNRYTTMADQQQLVTPQINASCFDLLIIEIVPLALRVINETTANAGAAGAVNDDDVYYKIEQFGFKLGRNLAEIFTRERERFQNQLDVMKFICKELWPLIFKKQIDNLKTNHRVRSLRGPRGTRDNVGPFFFLKK